MKGLLIGGVILLVVVFVLRGRSSPQASTGTISVVGPTATDAEIASARYNAASTVFSSLVNANAATQEAQAQSQASIDIAQITAPAYTQAAEAQSASAQAIAAIEAQAGVQEASIAAKPATIQAQTQQTGGFLSGIGGLLSSVVGGLLSIFNVGTQPSTFGGGYTPAPAGGVPIPTLPTIGGGGGGGVYL